jgi:LysR family hydrogen peroxide-inducible transcriptional activator
MVCVLGAFIYRAGRVKRQRLDIRDWEAFTTLVRLRHFGHAAEELGISQSAVSQRIAKLECDLQLKLLTRSNQGVELTCEGVSILPEARALIAAKSNALEAAAIIRENGARPIQLLLSNAIVHTALIPNLRRALETERQNRFHVDVASADEIEARLLSAEHDVAITTLTMNREGFQERLLTELPMAVAVPEEVIETSVSIEFLCRQPILTMPRDIEPRLFDRLITEAANAHQLLRIGQPVVAFPAILAMVLMGKGWGIVPLAMEGAVPKGVKVLPFTMEPPPTIRVLVAWRSGNPRGGQTADELLRSSALLN